MITEERIPENKQIEFVCIDQIVPKDHLVRKLEKAIDFTFIYDLVEDLYSDVGRPSIDPVILFKILFVKYIFGICSMCKPIEEIKTNNAYKWFLGYGFLQKYLTIQRFIKTILDVLGVVFLTLTLFVKTVSFLNLL